jgi:hypothetical protein
VCPGTIIINRRQAMKQFINRDIYPLVIPTDTYEVRIVRLSRDKTDGDYIVVDSFPIDGDSTSDDSSWVYSVFGVYKRRTDGILQWIADCGNRVDAMSIVNALTLTTNLGVE